MSENPETRNWKSTALTFLYGAVIAVVLLVPRLRDLDAMVTPDEPRWVARSANFGRAIELHQFADTYQAPHPGVTVMWLGAITLWLGGYRLGTDLSAPIGPSSVGKLIENSDHRPIDLLVEMRRSIILANVALYLVLFVLLTVVLGRFAAAVAVLFLGLDPMQIGFTRLLHMDGFSTMALIVATAGWSVWLLRRSRSALACSAVCGGLAMATRSADAVLPAILVVISIVDALILARGSVRQAFRATWSQIRALLIWCGIGAVTFIALWPAIWVAPIATLRQLRSDGAALALEAHASNVLFRGEVIHRDPGVLYYPIMLAIRTNPLTIVGLLCAISLLFLPTDPLVSNLRRLSAHFLTFALVYLMMLTVAAKKLDRYALPAMAALSLVAIIGFIGIAHWLKGRVWGRSRTMATVSFVGAIAAIVLVQAGIAGRSAPYYEDYLSPMMGNRAEIRARYSLANGEGGQAIAQMLANHPDISLDDVAGTNWQHTVDFYLPGKIAAVDRSETPASLVSLLDHRYLILTQPEIDRQLYPPRILAWLQSLTPIDSVSDKGRQIAWIYDLADTHMPIAAVGTDWPSWQFANGSQLLGVTTPDPVSPGGTIRIHTVWQAPEGTVDVRIHADLVAADGSVVATTDLARSIGPAEVLDLTFATTADRAAGEYMVRMTVTDGAGADLVATTLHGNEPVTQPFIATTVTITGPVDTPAASPTDSGESGESG